MSSVAKVLIFSTMIGCMMVAITTSDRWQQRMPKHWPIYIITLFMIYRIGAFAVLFPILDIPLTGDVIGFWDYAQQIHAGKTPLVDLTSGYGTPYNPLFYYVLSLAQTKHQMLLMFVIIEIFSFLAFFRLLQLFLSEQQIQLWSVLYVFSPVPFYYTVYSAQEDVWILLVYTISILLFLLNEGLLARLTSGAGMAIGLMTTKLTALLPLPLVFGLARNLVHIVLGYFFVLVIGLVLVLSLDPKPDMVVDLVEHASGAAGPSLWRVLNGLTQGYVPRTSLVYSLALFTCTWISAGVLGIRFSREDNESIPTSGVQGQRFVVGWIIIWTVFFLLSAHIWAAYTMFWLAPILALLVMYKPDRLLLGAILFVNLFPALNDLLYRLFGDASYHELDTLGDGVWFLYDIVFLFSHGYIGLVAIRILRLQRFHLGHRNVSNAPDHVETI